MRIFGAKSPIDRLGGEKPKRPSSAAPSGRLNSLVSQAEPLLEAKKVLDKVYSKGYFENHYPDADKLLKGILHKRAMDAWSHAEHFGSGIKGSPEKSDGGKVVIINVGV